MHAAVNITLGCRLYARCVRTCNGVRRGAQGTDRSEGMVRRDSDAANTSERATLVGKITLAVSTDCRPQLRRLRGLPRHGRLYDALARKRQRILPRHGSAVPTCGWNDVIYWVLIRRESFGFHST